MFIPIPQGGGARGGPGRQKNKPKPAVIVALWAAIAGAFGVQQVFRESQKTGKSLLPVIVLIILGVTIVAGAVMARCRRRRRRAPAPPWPAEAHGCAPARRCAMQRGMQKRGCPWPCHAPVTAA